ncbi:CAP domain-containing protein [Cohnella sp. 56]|uniref:CAP domain-containing protein n=1 Tax=Cohnella sp. 56 TaxID=3113722 RepID=UPI0030E9DB68
MKNNRIGQLALSGALVLSLAIPFSASANAATTSGTPTVRTYTYTLNASTIDASQLQQYLGSFDWQSLLAGLNGGGANGSAPTVTPAPTARPAPTVQPTAPAATPAPTVQPSKPVATPAPTAPPSIPAGAGSGTTGSGTSVQQSDFAAQVVNIVNQERAKAGLSALKTDAKLTTVADAKAKDMYSNNYFDHNSPTYGSPFDMMKQFGVTYSYAGENIAKGQRSPTEVMTAWMNSAGHKANIMNANFKSIGVAYYNGEWVQEFTG